MRPVDLNEAIRPEVKRLVRYSVWVGFIASAFLIFGTLREERAEAPRAQAQLPTLLHPPFPNPNVDAGTVGQGADPVRSVMVEQVQIASRIQSSLSGYFDLVDHGAYLDERVIDELAYRMQKQIARLTNLVAHSTELLIQSYPQLPDLKLCMGLEDPFYGAYSTRPRQPRGTPQYPALPAAFSEIVSTVQGRRCARLPPHFIGIQLSVISNRLSSAHLSDTALITAKKVEHLNGWLVNRCAALSEQIASTLQEYEDRDTADKSATREWYGVIWLVTQQLYELNREREVQARTASR